MRMVVKVGTSTLAHATGRLNIRHVEELVKVLSDLKNAGHEMILVSSGAIGEGMILYTRGPGVTEAEETAFLDAMAGAGRFAAIPERLADIGATVAGCGPAFVDIFVEALADGGVACGLPRAQALEFAAQMTLGAARLLLESGKHPGALKDAVCSPGGTTIQGVRVLEERAFRAAAMDAVIAAYEKTVRMGKR